MERRENHFLSGSLRHLNWKDRLDLATQRWEWRQWWEKRSPNVKECALSRAGGKEKHCGQDHLHKLCMSLPRRLLSCSTIMGNCLHKRILLSLVHPSRHLQGKVLRTDVNAKHIIFMNMIVALRLGKAIFY